MDRTYCGRALEAMLNGDGWKVLNQHIEEQMKEGWEKFIALEPEKKTAKMAFHYQAQYKTLKDLKEWIAEEIRLSKD